MKPIIITLPSPDQDLPISASAHRPIRNHTQSPREASPRKPLTHLAFGLLAKTLQPYPHLLRPASHFPPNRSCSVSSDC